MKAQTDKQSCMNIASHLKEEWIEDLTYTLENEYEVQFEHLGISIVAFMSENSEWTFSVETFSMSGDECDVIESHVSPREAILNAISHVAINIESKKKEGLSRHSLSDPFSDFSY